MDQKPLIVGSLFCFVIGIMLIFWTQQFLEPEDMGICELVPNKLVRIEGVYDRGTLSSNCSINVKFYGERPDNGETIKATGELEDSEFLVIGWELLK